MTVIGAAYCETGVFVFADSKRTDLLAEGSLPDAIKLTRVVPWGTVATAGAGSLGEAARLFLRSILFAYPPSIDEVLSEISGAMRFMYRRYADRTSFDQPTVALLAGVPPNGEPGMWTFWSDLDFEPTRFDGTAPFWTAASDTPAAQKALGELWTPDVRSSRNAALEWGVRSVMTLSERLPSIGPPVRMSIHLASGEWFQANYGLDAEGRPAPIPPRSI